MSVDLIARFECRGEHRDKVLALLSEYAQLVVESPGTLRFEAYTEAERPNVVVVVERYADDDAFRAHLDDPANAQFNRNLGPLITGDASELTFLAGID